ncbi:MAG: GNAT family N-acetyltransferase [Actinomycetota bacterium]|nr:GNAT family N-acetyltransferase [Actinomycetota bacterium]
MLSPDDVGHRVVVRHLLPGQRGPSGGPAMSDVLGILEEWGEEDLSVRRSDATSARIPRSDVVSAKRVPPRPPRRPRLDPEELQLICAEGWPAPVTQRLGDWLLRAAGGFTGRANSAAVCGDPGVGVDEALARVISFSVAHGVPPLAQVVVGSAWEQQLLARGWVDRRPQEGGVLVQVAAVDDALSRRPPGETRVVLRDALTPQWLEVYGRAAGTDPAVARRLLEGPPTVAFAHVDDAQVSDHPTPFVTRQSSRVAGIGRAALTGSWIGLSAVEVRPEHRRRGVGTALVSAMLAWAAERGARRAYLQVTPGNVAAVALYASYGFRTHHRYRYLRPRS